ncbi:uncharacterized protein LOC144508931 [Mustelus asterias]
MANYCGSFPLPKSPVSASQFSDWPIFIYFISPLPSRKCGQENNSIPRQQPAARKGSKKRQRRSRNGEAAATTHRDNGVDSHQLGEDTELTDSAEAFGKEPENLSLEEDLVAGTRKLNTSKDFLKIPKIHRSG